MGHTIIGSLWSACNASCKLHAGCMLATIKSCRIVSESIEMEYVLWKSSKVVVLMKLYSLAADL